jgi:hypothetical protein
MSIENPIAWPEAVVFRPSWWAVAFQGCSTLPAHLNFQPRSWQDHRLERWHLPSYSVLVSRQAHGDEVLDLYPLHEDEGRLKSTVWKHTSSAAVEAL